MITINHFVLDLPAIWLVQASPEGEKRNFTAEAGFYASTGGRGKVQETEDKKRPAPE